MKRNKTGLPLLGDLRQTEWQSQMLQLQQERDARPTDPNAPLRKDIERAEQEVTARYRDKLELNHDLNRMLVSFQANKSEIGYKWCKYKEGFSAALVRYLLVRMEARSGTFLDPFAGAGTTLFEVSASGLDAVGIELLPSSAEIIAVRKILAECDRSDLGKRVKAFCNHGSWRAAGPRSIFPHLRITQGAFPSENEIGLERYLAEVTAVSDPIFQRVLRFAALCILEPISFTRKDGQYLRWDARSGRNNGSRSFFKGPVWSFDRAITSKLDEIASDLLNDGRLFDPPSSSQSGRITLIEDSCLRVLPRLPNRSFNGIITSPPYCNRYDYTRTYALELAMLGKTEEEVRALRQAMLTCTVENRGKEELGTCFGSSAVSRASSAVQSHEVLGKILEYLDRCNAQGVLNNSGIPRMVRNYFLELYLVIGECARLLTGDSRFVMVNDNVRYHGVHVPVDLILSQFAVDSGFSVERIWVLPRGKGNSSQQMGAHGREEVRKCVYVWRLERN